MPPIKIDLARLQQLTGPFVDELLSARRNLGLPTSLVSLTTDREELGMVFKTSLAPADSDLLAAT